MSKSRFTPASKEPPIPPAFLAGDDTRLAIAEHHASTNKKHPSARFAQGWLTPRDKCKTAYWTYDPKTKTEQIRLNPASYAHFTRQTDPDAPLFGVKQEFDGFFRALYNHERAHSVFTSKELVKFPALIKAAGIPWRLANLFEDCRVEGLWVGLTETLFGWTTWGEDYNLQTPTGLLLAFKTAYSGVTVEELEPASLAASSRAAHFPRTAYRDLLYRERAIVENINDAVIEGAAFLEPGQLLYDKVAKVFAFYRRIRAAKSTEELLPILKDWVIAFPPEGKGEEGGGEGEESEGNTPSDDSELGAGGGDLADAIDEAVTKEYEDGNPETEGEPKADGTADTGNGEDTSRPPTSIRDEDGEVDREGAFTYGHKKGYGVRDGSGFTPSATGRVEENQEKRLAAKLASYLARAFKEEGAAVRNGPTPSKKLNIRGLIRGDINNPYKVKRNAVEAERPHISIIFDCSGSMASGYGGISPEDVSSFARFQSHAGYPEKNKANNRSLISVLNIPHARLLNDASKAKVPVDARYGVVRGFRCSGLNLSSETVEDYDGTPLYPNAIHADRAGRVLARALDILAKKGILTATVYASAAGGLIGKFNLPQKDNRKFRILRGFSGEEGLSETLSPTKGSRSAFAEITKTSRLVLVWTDGNITDGPLQRGPLRQRGLYTVGLLASLENNTAALDKHFDASICRSSLFATASALVKLIKSGATKKATAPLPKA